MEMAGLSPNGYKTLWEKEKLLIMSNFSFSHGVFKRFVIQTRKNLGLFGKGLIKQPNLEWTKVKTISTGQQKQTTQS